MTVTKRISLNEEVYSFLEDEIKKNAEKELQIGDIIGNCVGNSKKIANIPESLIKSLNLVFANADIMNIDRDKIVEDISRFLKEYYKNMIDEIM